MNLSLSSPHTLFGIFLTPMFFYVVYWFSGAVTPTHHNQGDGT
jgi:hypothetical protein